MLIDILLSFIPIFVAVDAIGVLPIFVSLTDGMEQKERTKIIQSMITAIIIALGFILIGRVVFRLLGIEMGDFMIAGGAILFYLAIINIVFAGFIFKSSFAIMKVLGVAGTKALSKIVSLLLAAIAVMLRRKGLLQFL